MRSIKKVEIWAWIGKGKEVGVSENLRTRAKVMDDPGRCQVSGYTYPEPEPLLQ